MALIEDEPPSPSPRGWSPMRPLRPACGTVSNAQLLTLPETIRISAPGVVTTQLSSLPPASSSATDVLGSSDRRLATAQPPEPPPTTTKSNVSITRTSPCFYHARHCEERRDEAIHRASCSTGGLLRCARNDGHDMNRKIFCFRTILAP